MRQVAVYSGVERRRRWDDETRLKVLSEAFAPGGNIAQVARHHDISTGQLYTWRRKLMVPPAEPLFPVGVEFAEAVLAGDPAAVPSGAAPALVVDLARSRKVTIFASASASASLVEMALKALR